MTGTLRAPAAVRLVHTVADTLTVRAAGTEILRYHYRPERHPSQCPSPYAYPLRTLAGRTVTGERPPGRRGGHDHRGHLGPVRAESPLPGRDFGDGGPAAQRATGDGTAGYGSAGFGTGGFGTGGHGSAGYGSAGCATSGSGTSGFGTAGYGYPDLPGVGRKDHTGFTAIAAGGRTALTETVDWIAPGGERLVAEERSWQVRDVDPHGGSWTLEFSAALLNVLGAPLHFGGPALFGSELAGRCGVFWCGPRDVTGYATSAPGGAGAHLTGTRAPWLAFTGAFGGADTHATLVFHAGPRLPGGDPHWFVGGAPYPAVSPTLALHGRLPLADGAILRLAYRLVIADGVWDRDRITAHLADHPW